MPLMTTPRPWPTARAIAQSGGTAAPRAEPQSRLDLRYGERPRATLDYFPAKAKAPLFVFIHGGYWQRNEKERFAFTADGPRAHGINVAVPGYTLGPQARMTDI